MIYAYSISNREESKVEKSISDVFIRNKEYLQYLGLSHNFCEIVYPEIISTVLHFPTLSIKIH